jgi:hypothetical protein
VARGVHIDLTMISESSKQRPVTPSTPAPSVPTRNIPRCKECGDVDADVRAGGSICRGCSDALTASLAFTD